MIYAELLSKPGGLPVRGSETVFLNMAELAAADERQRQCGKCYSGALATNIALNRHRHNRCMWCGAKVGSDHVDCQVGRISNTA